MPAPRQIPTGALARPRRRERRRRGGEGVQLLAPDGLAVLVRLLWLLPRDPVRRAAARCFIFSPPLARCKRDANRGAASGKNALRLPSVRYRQQLIVKNQYPWPSPTATAAVLATMCDPNSTTEALETLRFMIKTLLGSVGWCVDKTRRVRRGVRTVMFFEKPRRVRRGVRTVVFFIHPAGKAVPPTWAAGEPMKFKHVPPSFSRPPV